jgi:hypothetical protein
MEICDQFRRLDPSNCGHITLPHLLEGRSWQNNYKNIIVLAQKLVVKHNQ